MSLPLAAVPCFKPLAAACFTPQPRVTTEHSVVLHTEFVVCWLVKEQSGQARAGHRQLQSAPPTEARTVQPPSRHHAAADGAWEGWGQRATSRAAGGAGRACVFWGTQVLMRI